MPALTIVSLFFYFLKNIFHILMPRDTSSAQVASVVLLLVLLTLCHLMWLTISRPTFQRAYSQAKLLFVDVVIRMIIKERSSHLKHVSRTHRVDLDWLFDRIKLDHTISKRYVRTAESID